MTGDLNRRITVRSWATIQDDGGGAIEVQTGSYTMWAKITSRSAMGTTNFGPKAGENININAQELWTTDYFITIRAELSRRIGPNFLIDYDGKRLKINSRAYNDEGKRDFVLLKCTAIEADVASNGNGTFIPDTNIKIYTYKATEEVSSFVAPELIGKTIFNVTKDGVGFEVILNGVPEGKQVLFDPATGTLTWSVPFAISDPLETAIINYF